MKRVAMIVLAAATAAALHAGGGTEGSKPAAPTTLNFFSWYGTETTTFNDTLAKKVSALDPALKIEIEPVVWDQMHPLLQSRIAGNQMPDLIDFKGQDISKYGKAGNLLDLSGKPWLDAVPASAREILKVDGKEYGFPYSALFQGVMFNRAMFAKYGIKTPDTYAELMAAAATLRKNGVVPFATHFKDNWNIGNITMQFAMAEVFRGNPRWGYDLYEGKVGFESSEGYRRVFQRVKDLYDNTWKDTFSVDFTEACKRFAKGEAAMFVTGTWSNTNFAMNPDLDWGIFPFPGVEPGAKLIFEPNHTWAISASSKNPEAALRVLELVAKDKELAKILADEANTYSLLVGVDKTKAYPVDKDIAAYKAKNQVTDVSLGNNQIKWAYQEEYSRYIAEWLLGSKSLDDALKAATAYKANVKM